jgi:hypothetical protein
MLAVVVKVGGVRALLATLENRGELANLDSFNFVFHGATPLR